MSSSSGSRRIASNQIDWQQRSFDFPVGSYVYPFLSGNRDLMGRVVAIYPAIGMADVQWPHGSERVPVEELQRYEEENYIPPGVDDSTVPGGTPASVVKADGESDAPNLDKNGEPIPKVAETKGIHDWLPGGLGDGVSPDDVPADQLVKGIKVEMEHTSDPNIARELAVDHLTEDPKYYDKLEVMEKKASTQRVAEAWVKKALYWGSSDRKYKCSDAERSSGEYLCPRCRQAVLRKAVYKRRDGQSEKLLGCPNCLFLIKRTDIIGDPDYFDVSEGEI